MNCYYYARFKHKLDNKWSNAFLVGLSGNAKQRRTMLRAFKRSKTHVGFVVEAYKPEKHYSDLVK